MVSFYLINVYLAISRNGGFQIQVKTNSLKDRHKFSHLNPVV